MRSNEFSTEGLPTGACALRVQAVHRHKQHLQPSSSGILKKGFQTSLFSNSCLAKQTNPHIQVLPKIPKGPRNRSQPQHPDAYVYHKHWCTLTTHTLLPNSWSQLGLLDAGWQDWFYPLTWVCKKNRRILSSSHPLFTEKYHALPRSQQWAHGLRGLITSSTAQRKPEKDSETVLRLRPGLNPETTLLFPSEYIWATFSAA